ncbi:amino acid adenylation domain-containing protein [Stigmatella sp. ncwal1]|uniref:Amino acid adenylation domain-containing protein n=1 Tax=Stigmatella ashevillensis TaxID=2995309 RepID=A0ABT5D195_9BACT|nr:non-ribosomal peptide synthetase [Stigmatella ashevillena]MDC0706903.1 amino acid adenylation domain-containing protein [Stigmatella ashevillena]
MSELSKRIADLPPEKRQLLLRRLAEQQKKASAPASAEWPVRDASQPAPLSFAQQRLWFLEQLQPGNALYNLLMVIRMDGRLDAAVLEKSFNAIIARHEALRTVFVEREGQPSQVISPPLALQVPVEELGAVPGPEREKEIRRLANEEASRPFDLTRGPLLRMRLLKLEEQAHVLILTVHHIVFDGWSQAVLLRELEAFYGAFLAGKEPSLPPLPVQYADYAVWQRQWLRGAALESQLGYWKEKLRGPPPMVELPVDRPRPALRTTRGARLFVELPRPLSEALAALSRQEGATLFMTLIAALKTLLFRYTQQTDITTGYVTAGRERREVEGLIGFFVNTLALRVDLSGAPSFRTLLARTRVASMEAFAHQELPFEQLVDALQLERDLSRSPLFQVMLVHQPLSKAGLGLPGLSLGSMDIQPETAKFDLTLLLHDTERGTVAGSWEYNTDLFDAGTIARLAKHYEQLLQAIVAHPDQRITELGMMGEEERRELVEGWNQTGAEYERQKCVHELFEEQAKRTPEALAVRDGREQVTYGELNRRANQLAQMLVKKGVGPEQVVGLCTERTVGTVVGLLGILKAGGAYVPLDPAYPVERLRYMLEDTGAKVVVTQSWLVERLGELKAEVVSLDRQAEEIEREAEQCPASGVTSRNLAYVIYTSGSTGKPKGAMLEHQGVCNYLSWSGREYRVEEGKGAPVHSSISFDLTVTSLVLPLVKGKPVEMVGEEEGVEGLGEALRKGGDYSLVKLTPTHLRVLSQQLKEEEAKGRTRAFIIGGEGLTAESLRYWRKNAPGTRLINEYGPTETVVGCSTYEVEEGDGEEGAVPIGHPIANTQLYVLDGGMEVVPKGVVGELYIGGEGVGRGYLGRPELTAERFVPDPYSQRGGGRLYRTGDLVKRRADGKLEYLGRMDTQVKVRGYRIELGEIETVLSKHPAVHETVVVVREDVPGGARLVAYVTTHPGQGVLEGDLRTLLLGKLPEYMVPAAFVLLEKLPLTPNGKVDRRALPAPVAPEAESFATPRSPSEELVAGIWAQLLGIPKVGRHDNLFALGGNSLLAMQVASRLRNAFRAELPLRWLFEAPTVSALAQRVDSAQREMHAPQSLQLARVPRDRPLPLSFSQQRLWFLDQLSPGDPSFNMTLAARVTGPLEVERLEWSLRELCRRHESLRTTFATVQGQTVQVISPEPRVQLSIVDLSGLPGQEREAEVQRRADEDAAQPFDLAKGPLLRAQLLRLAPQEWGLLLALHHIVADGWSMGLFFKELGARYEAHSHGRLSPLPELPIQYADYAVWQRSWLSGEVLDAQLGYWRKQLSGAPAVLELPTDRPRPAVRSTRGALAVGPTLSSSLIQSLRGLAQKEGVTFFMLMEAAFHALLHRYSGQEDISVGTTIAGRTRTETESLIGLFINTLVLRVNLGGDPTFRELLGRVREVALGAYAHQDVPFERLVDELAPSRSLSHSPLFQVVFDVGIPQGGPPATLAEFKLTPLSTQVTTTKFDLALLMVDHEDGMVGLCQYSTELFDAETIQRMLSHLKRMLEGVSADAEQRLSKLPLMGEEEKRQVLKEWNATGEEVEEGSLHEVFAEQARRTPEAVAVSSEGTEVTYGQLEKYANQLAHYLRQRGVGPDVVVGLCMEKGVELVVGMLGILKAGGAYLPLDPGHPMERLGYMLSDTGSPVLVTQERLGYEVPSYGEQRVLLDVEWEQMRRQPEQAPSVEVSPGNLAYVIYTSGSTGKPKGVLIEHRSVLNTLRGSQRECEMGPGQKLMPFASIGFDAAVQEMMLPLLSGGTLAFAPAEALMPGPEMGRFIREQGITHLVVATPVLSALPYEKDSPLRTLVVGGEACPAELVDRWAPGRRFIQQYGPTEASITTASKRCEAGQGKPPFGKPYPNTRLYVLSANLEPVPVGVTGELYIGGEGVGRGYLGRAELTASSFIPDPFSEQAGERLYRTGDRVRYRADGNLEFVGRADGQVKVRGHRIELGEIEAVLSKHHAVREGVVVVREEVEGNKRLVAYVVGQEGEEVEAERLKGFVGERLPEYMVPTAYVVMEALPLTANGKVDHKALPPPGQSEVEAKRQVAPRNQTEELVAGIWGELLGVDKVGVHDNFFDLGGHSLMATQVLSRIRDTLHVELAVSQLFKFPTVAGLAQLLASASDSQGPQAPPILPVPRGGEVPLSFAQERLWFMDQLEPGSALFNVPIALRFQGQLDATALEKSLQEIIRRHEVLRTNFVATGDKPVQVITPDLPFLVLRVDLSGLSAQEREVEVRRRAGEDAHKPFALDKEPLVRAQLLRVSPDEHVLLLSMHHIVNDAWSGGIFFSELASFYQGFATGNPVSLPELPIQYADYAVWQRSWLSGEVLEAQLDYWRKQLSGAPAVLELPTDRPRPAVRSTRGASLGGFELSPNVTRALRGLAQKEGVTFFMLMEAAFHTLLHRYSGQEDISVGTTIAGRTRTETEPLIGLFMNTLVLRVNLGGDPTFRELLGRVREVALGAYAHQDVPFERLVDELAPSRSLSHSPLFQVVFDLRNASSNPNLGDLQISGVKAQTVTTKFDLALMTFEQGDGLAGFCDYSTDLFDAETVQRMLSHLKRMLEGVSADAEQRLSKLPLMGEEEKRQVLKEWNATGEEVAEGSLHEVFAEQARRTPEAVAVSSEGTEVTYGQLEKYANQLAHYLRQRGVGPDVVVGLCMEKGVELVVGLLGILKAGGAYLPLDPGHPMERLGYMLSDTGSPVLVTQERLGYEVPSYGEQRVLLDVEWEQMRRQPEQAPSVEVSPGNLAYVIYTSGSTGKPKGVLIEHRSVLNTLRGSQRECEMGPGQKLMPFASIGFDAAVQEMMLPLLSGGTLVFAPAEALMPGPEMGRFIREQGITHLVVATPVLSALPYEKDSPLRTLVVGGEACPAELVDRWAPGRRFIQQYGPTEASITTASKRCEAGQGKPPFGKPYPNTRLYVLSASLEPVPVGVTGELYIGGEGVGRGYLGRAELTASSFIPDPFSEQAGERLYRTGDRVRYRADGNLEFVGRADGQVKVRGHRIELGEIEAVLSKHHAVREGVVVVREEVEGNKRLVAYVVGQEGEEVEAERLKGFVGERLPEYMVPTAYVVMEALPLTANGKVDHKALPPPGQSEVEAKRQVAPRNQTEELVAGIWGELLGVDKVGVHDNFFDLGGHSLMSVKIISRIRAIFDVELAVLDIFEQPTVAQLVEKIVASRAGSKGSRPPPIVPSPPVDSVPLSFAQQLAWMPGKLPPEDPVNLVPLIFRLEGHLDEAALTQSLEEMVRRHEALRTTFPLVDGVPVQRIHPTLPVELPVVDLTHLPEARREAEALRQTEGVLWQPFDLAQGPLLRFGLFRLSERAHVLFLGMHHVLTDFESASVFLNELEALYGAYREGKPSPLPPVALQYRDYTLWEQQRMHEGGLERLRAYWARKLASPPEMIRLPFDRAPTGDEGFEGASHAFELPESLSETVRAFCVKEGLTPFLFMLAVFETFLARSSQQEDFLVSFTQANRTQAECEKMLGVFANITLLRCGVSGNPSFRELLGRVRTEFLEAFDHADMPYVEKARLLGTSSQGSNRSPVQIGFAFPSHSASASLRFGDLVAVPLAISRKEWAPLDLSLSMSHGPRGFVGMFNYRTRLFESSTIKALEEYFQALVGCVIADPDQPLQALPALPLFRESAHRHHSPEHLLNQVAS